MMALATPQLALQLYTLRSLRLPLDALARAAAEAGYDGVELVGDHGTSDHHALPLAAGQLVR